MPAILAKTTWQLWAVAFGIIVLTQGLSIKVPAETFALLLICVGFLLGIVMLATIPKYGAKNILKPALLGVALNGLLLAVAIPNFINARNAAIAKNMAAMKEYKIADRLWKEYQIAGLQLMSPVGLEKRNLSTVVPSEKVEAYMGQLLPYAFTVALSRREMSTNNDYSLDVFAAEAADLLREKFPQGFKSDVRDGVVDGIPAKELSLEFHSRGAAMKDTAILFLKEPFAWEVQVIAPKDFPALDAETGKILNSIKLFPAGR
jgi:hypothetical protein